MPGKRAPENAEQRDVRWERPSRRGSGNRPDALLRCVNSIALLRDQTLSAETPVPIAVGEYGDLRASTIDGQAGGRRLKHIAGCGIDVGTVERLPDVVANRAREGQASQRACLAGRVRTRPQCTLAPNLRPSTRPADARCCSPASVRY